MKSYPRFSLLKLLWAIVSCLTIFVSLDVLAQQPNPRVPQGLLWYLREFGTPEQAQLLEDQLKQIMLDFPMDYLKHASRGGQGSMGKLEAWMPGNVYLFMKGREVGEFPMSLGAELGASLLDRHLHLDMVPLTVLREVGGELRMVQLFYPALPYDSASFAAFEASSVKKDVEIFDYIVGNFDREGGSNMVRGQDGRWIAVDFSRALTERADNLSPRPKPSVEGISSHFAQGILNMNVDVIRKDLAPHVHPESLEILLGKLHEIRNELITAGWDARKESREERRPDPNPKREFETPQEFPVEDYYDIFGAQHVFRNLPSTGPTAEARALVERYRDRPQILGALAHASITVWPRMTAKGRAELLKLLGDEAVVRVLPNAPFVVRDLAIRSPEMMPLLLKASSWHAVDALREHGGNWKIVASAWDPLLDKISSAGSFGQSRLHPTLDQLFPGPLSPQKKLFAVQLIQGLKKRNFQFSYAQIFELSKRSNADELLAYLAQHGFKVTDPWAPVSETVLSCKAAL